MLIFEFIKFSAQYSDIYFCYGELSEISISKNVQNSSRIIIQAYGDPGCL